MKPLKLLFTLTMFVMMGNSVTSQEMTQELVNVEFEEFNQLINSGQGILMDVRTLEEFTEGHIEGAINVVYSMFGYSGKIRDMDREETYYIYCRSGNRSGKSLKIMEKMGFKKVYNLSGGLLKWRKNGLPITK